MNCPLVPPLAIIRLNAGLLNLSRNDTAPVYFNIKSTQCVLMYISWRKSVPLRPSDCSHGKAMRQSASASHFFPPPMYTIFQVYAKRKLAGFADKAFSVDNARSQTRLSSFAQRAKLAGFADSAHSVDKAQSQTRNAHSAALAPLCISHTQLVKAADRKYLFATEAIAPVRHTC